MLNDLLIFLGLEGDLLPDKLARLLGLMIYHFFMISVTGGLWFFWLFYKYLRKY